MSISTPNSESAVHVPTICLSPTPQQLQDAVATGVLGLFAADSSPDLEERNRQLLARLEELGLQPQGLRRADVRRLAPRVDVHQLVGGYWLPEAIAVESSVPDSGTTYTYLTTGPDPMQIENAPVVILHGGTNLFCFPNDGGYMLTMEGDASPEQLLSEFAKWMPIVEALPVLASGALPVRRPLEELL